MRIPSSPRAHLLLVATLVALAALSAFTVDRAIVDEVVTWPPPVLDTFEWITMLGHSTKYIVVSALIWLVFRLIWKRERERAWAALVFGAIVIPGLVVTVLKIVIGRARPIRWLDAREFELQPFSFDYTHSSMPSGHSCSIFALATALAMIFPRARWTFFAIAVIVALSRVIVQAHYLSDVIIGSYLGVLGAWWWSTRVRGLTPALRDAPE